VRTSIDIEILEMRRQTREAREAFQLIKSGMRVRPVGDAPLWSCMSERRLYASHMYCTSEICLMTALCIVKSIVCRGW